MPGADADRLTRQHRDQVAAIGRVVVRPVRRMARQAPTADVDGWLERILPRLLATVLAGWTASRGRAVTYLSQHAAAEGREVDPVPALWVPQRVIASARVTGPVAFKETLTRTGSVEAAARSMVEQLPPAMQRQAMAGSRDTIARTVGDSDEIVGWRRVTDADPCAFCALLASRGAVYSAGTVRFQAHDGDECSAEPLYGHEEEPAEVEELYDEWLRVTAGTSGKESIRVWRRHWDAKRAAGRDTAGRTLTPDQAEAMQRQMMAGAEWTPAQREALREYSAGWAGEMNGLLRTGKGDATAREFVKAAASAMRPLPEDVRLYRFTAPDGLGVESVDDLAGLVGKTLQDRGFMSSSIAESGWTSEQMQLAARRQVLIRIDAPAGTPAAYIERISAHPGQWEMLLAPGTKCRVTAVETRGRQTVVTVRVVP